VWEFGLLILLIAVLMAFLAPRFIARGPRLALASGTLRVTGVSSGAASDGQQIATIAGVIDGPTVSEYAVYRRMVVNVGHWPVVGEVLPVVYSPKNPNNWSFAPAAPTDV
jgi:hypothetical protein